MMANQGYDLRQGGGHNYFLQGGHPRALAQYPAHHLVEALPAGQYSHSAAGPAAYHPPRPSLPYQYYPAGHHQQPNISRSQQQQHVVTMLVDSGLSNVSHIQQKSAAAAFFARKAAAQVKQQVIMQAADRFAAQSSEEEEDLAARLRTNFRAVICRAPPAIPPGLLARLEATTADEGGGVGKVRVMLRIISPGLNNKLSSCNDDHQQHHTRSYFSVDKRRRQVTLLDPTTVDRAPGSEVGHEERNIGVAAPKMFAFDGLFGGEDDTSGGGDQEAMTAACLPDLITAVVAHGCDGCLFSFGHSRLGKSCTMVGRDTSRTAVGMMPAAIAWLYRAIKERKARTSARFSVRVSAVEIGQGEGEATRDLLERFATGGEQSPGMYLRNLPNTKVRVETFKNLFLL
jgi:kinesin family protein 26